MFMLNSGVRNAYTILFMYLFSFFHVKEKKKSSKVFCTPRFGKKKSNWSTCLLIPKSQDST